MIYDDILGTIGNTPVVRINRLAPPQVTMYVKCEAFNPLSSVKDRLAIGIIEDAERRGTLKPGQTVVEATSGNTGIALAMVCAVKGYPFVALMPESFSVERRKLMRILGAKVILTAAAERASGAVRKTEELAKKHGWFVARQFSNPANPEYHRNKIQGWTPDFIPEVLDRDVYDELITVTDVEARDAALDLATKEGIFCGISGLGDPAMLPDTGERYFTTVLFEGINKGSDEEPAA
jgi:cysteine synthase